jgi:Xaa-Pro dipeptidase
MGFYEERIKRIKSEMQRAELDALVLFKPQNTYYVSCFNAIIYSRPVIATLPLEGEPTLIVPRLRMGHAKEESRIEDVRVYHKIRISQAPAGIATNPMDLLKDVLKEHNVLRGKIGIEMDFLPITTFEELRKTLRSASFIDASNIFRKLRIVKDEEEIEMIRRAAEISDVGMEAAIEAISERKTEIEVSISAMSAMNEYWEDKYPESEVSDFGGLEGGIVNALWCYCLSGPRVSFACESPSTHKLRDGDIPVTVILTTLNAYHAENERTVVVGKMTKKQRKAFEAYLDARQKVLDAIRPGVTCSEVAKAGADALEKLGYAKYAIARAGHSMGLSMHEEPSFRLGEETILQPNMVMSVEPTIAIEGVGTFDHSDVIVVTKKGHRLLTKYRRNLITV